MERIVPERTREGFRDQIVGLVNARKEHSENHFTGVRNSLPRLYDLWRGVYTGSFSPHMNNVHIPLIFSAIASDVAKKVSVSYSQWPVLNFLGYGPDDAPICRKQEALISAQMKDAAAFEKEYQTFLTADLYGVAISQVMWDYQCADRMIERFEALPLSGEMVRTLKKEKVISFDGPNWENVDRLDFFPQPGHRNIRKMQWCGRRYFLDIDEVRFMASEHGKYTFDPAEVARLEREGSARASSDEVSYRRFDFKSGSSQATAKFSERYSRPIEIIEMWGMIPSELALDGDRNRVITIAEGKFLLRNRPNPFHHGQKPFLSFSPNPDPHYFDAPGKAEICEKMQFTANRYINQQLDATDIAANPMFVFNKNRILNIRKLYSKPGALIGVDGTGALADAIMPLSADLRGVDLSSRKMSELWGFMQMGTGVVDDAIMGMQGSDPRQTAREFVGRREAAGTRLAMESRIYEENYLEPLGNMMISLNKQFLKPPVEILILGDSAKVDPVTGAPVMSTRETITGYDLNFTYAARAMGATTALSRSARQNNMATVLQLVSAQPAVAGAVNMVNFMRQIFREFEFPNVNELIQQISPLQQAMGSGGFENASEVPEANDPNLGALMGMTGPQPPMA